jgi:hypothetical protein
LCEPKSLPSAAPRCDRADREAGRTGIDEPDEDFFFLCLPFLVELLRCPLCREVVVVSA